MTPNERDFWKVLVGTAFFIGLVLSLVQWAESVYGTPPALNGEGTVVSWKGSVGCSVRMDTGELKHIAYERVPVGWRVKITLGLISESKEPKDE